MGLKHRGRTLVAGLGVGILLGAGLATVTPAGAAVKDAAAAINWKTIWKTEIKPRADKRYYTKKKANARYYTKAQAASLFETKAAHDASMATALGNYYTKAQSDANYYSKTQSDANYYSKTQSDANYYSKTQSDAKYAPAMPLVRGSLMILGTATGAGQWLSDEGSFGATFSAPPTVHVIAVGGLPPAGCSGTAEAPNAAAGHLCVFQTSLSNTSAINICAAATHSCPGASDPWGFAAYTTSIGAGTVQGFAVWAARATAIANPSNPIFVHSSNKPSADGQPGN